MIRTFEQFEKLNWKSLFRKKSNTSSKLDDHMGLDPYGEEIWDDRVTFYNWLVQNHPDRTTWNNIRVLHCSYNSLTSLEGVENLVKLEILSCHNNSLTSLEGVENLVNLTHLYCYNNSLTSLEGVENLVKLEILSCHNNSLTSLEGLENLVNLTHLYCYNNSLSSEYKDRLRNYCTKRKIYLNI